MLGDHDVPEERTQPLATPSSKGRRAYLSGVELIAAAEPEDRPCRILIGLGESALLIF